MVKIRVVFKHRSMELTVSQEETILTAFQKNQIWIQAPCNGRGTCGKCKVHVDGETIEKLACQTYPEEGMVIRLQEEGASIRVLSDFVCESQQMIQDESQHVGEYYVAIDLGTTTIVTQLLKRVSEGLRCLQTIRGINPQTSFGADVISRITAANGGQAKELQACVKDYLEETIELLCIANDLQHKTLSKIVIAGNTTMIHLLYGYDVSGLGLYPFQTTCLAPEIKVKDQVSIVAVPGISAFVGGDITAGIYAIGMEQEEKPVLLVDLGTNGEIAIGNSNRILVTSASAGPAFEGGNLSCGVGSIPGAICEVSIKRRYTAYKTIDNRPAIGLCGTGAIELLAELLEKGEIDSHGTFVNEEYRIKGFPVDVMGNIRILQEDIRQLQLAKAAIRTGIEAVIDAFGTNYDEIAHLYLAGGMGYTLNVEKACRIGLIPRKLQDKVQCVGNSSLGGVKRYLTNLSEEASPFTNVTSKAQTIQLATKSQFSHNYLNYMDFTEAVS